MIKLFSLLLNSTARFKNWNGRFGFKLLCRVQRTAHSKVENSLADKATFVKMTHNGYEATLFKLGNGPKKLLFLHGWKSHSARWTPLFVQMDLEKYTCYALDAPAHGLSAGNSLNLEIYRYFMMESISSIGSLHAVVAHSLGSLVTAYGYLVDQELPVDRFIISGAPAGMQSIYDFFIRIMRLKPRVIENMNNYISQNVTQINAIDINLQSFFTQVDRPVMVIHDEDDRVCPIEPIKTAVDDNTQIETFYTKGLGHDLQSIEVNTKIVNFLGR